MKRLPIFLMLALAAGAQTPTPVPERTVRTFRYLSDMDASAPIQRSIRLRPALLVEHPLEAAQGVSVRSIEH
jgi:hypothetical protein